MAQEIRELDLFASAARIATVNGSDVNNWRHRGIRLWLDITAVSGTTPTLDVKLQGKDRISGVYVDIPSAAFAQKTANGSDDLLVYPGVAETANRSVSDVLPKTFRVVATIGGTTPSFTFSLSGELLP
jgi:hypothetical protein